MTLGVTQLFFACYLGGLCNGLNVDLDELPRAMEPFGDVVPPGLDLSHLRCGVSSLDVPVARLALASRVRLVGLVPLDDVVHRPTLSFASYRAELSGDGVTVTVRVVEYYAEVEGQVVPEMFCLVTELMDYEEYLGLELATFYE